MRRFGELQPEVPEKGQRGEHGYPGPIHSPIAASALSAGLEGGERAVGRKLEKEKRLAADERNAGASVPGKPLM